MALTDNIVAYYKLDESSGTTLNDEVSTNDLTASNASILNASGFLNRCIYPNATYYASTLPAFSTAGSLSFWFKNSTYNIVDNFVGGKQNAGLTANEWGISIEYNTGKIWFWIEDTGAQQSVISNSNVSDGNWHHCVVVWSYGNASDMIMYIDGSAQTTTATSGNAPTGRGYLGGVVRGGSPTWLFTGYIDEFGIWSRKISSTEVTALYNSGEGFEYPFSTDPNMKINIGDAWKQVDTVKINIGDAWKTANAIKINIGDAWKTIL